MSGANYALSGGWDEVDSLGDNTTLTNPPLLSIHYDLGTGMLTLSWPSSAKNYKLEVCSDLGDGLAWNTVSTVPSEVETRLQIVLQPQSQHQFYRLQKSP